MSHRRRRIRAKNRPAPPPARLVQPAPQSTTEGPAPDFAEPTPTAVSALLRDAHAWQPQQILTLQRALGNQAVQRLLAHPPAPVIQRESIKDKLNEALDGWSADVSQVRVIIAQASPAEKQEILNDPALLTRLSDKLSSGQMLEILKSLNAPLKMRLNAAMNGWGADKVAILDLTASASDPEKADVLNDPALVARLKSELDRDTMLTVLKNLNAPLKLRLDVAMKGWGADKKTILELSASASDPEKADVLNDPALVARLKSELSRKEATEVLKNLNAPVKDVINTLLDGWGVDPKELVTLIKDPKVSGRVKAELPIAEASAIFKSASVSLRDQIEMLLNFWDAGLGDLTPIITAASEDEKKATWSDAAFMTQCEAKLGRQAYLTFITQLGMFHEGVTEEDKKKHTSARDADEAIREQLKAYVGEAAKAGRGIQGMVAVVDDADWDRAGEAHYGRDVWHTGPPPKRTSINGFVDAQDRVWIHKNRGNAGTMIHEALHKWSSGGILGTLGFNLNEGVTEYFTRKVCKPLGITGRGNYASQHAVANSLAGLVSEATLAGAYFDGSVDAMKTAFVTARNQKAWDDFVQAMKDGKFGDAQTLITTPVPAPAPAPAGP